MPKTKPQHRLLQDDGRRHLLQGAPKWHLRPTHSLWGYCALLHAPRSSGSSYHSRSRHPHRERCQHDHNRRPRARPKNIRNLPGILFQQGSPQRNLVRKSIGKFNKKTCCVSHGHSPHHGPPKPAKPPISSRAEFEQSPPYRDPQRRTYTGILPQQLLCPTRCLLAVFHCLGQLQIPERVRGTSTT